MPHRSREASSANLIKEMKTKPKLNMDKDKGEGHKARLALDLKGTVEIDGTKQEYNCNWDVTITIEMVDYAVRLIAGGIAQAANRIATDGLSGDRKTAEEVKA